VKVGRVGPAVAQVYTMLIGGVGGQGFVWNVTVNGLYAQFVEPSSSSVAAIATGLAAAITAVPGMSAICTAVASTATITITAASKLVDLKIQRSKLMMSLTTFTCTTSYSNPTTGLNNIALNDGAWYGLALADQNEVAIGQVAAWAETAKKLFAYVISDTENETVSGTNTLGALKALGYAQTFGFFHSTSGTHAGAAALGYLLSTNPGSSTLTFKALPGVPADDLTATVRTNVQAQYGNTYENAVNGQGTGLTNIVTMSKTASGEYADVMYLVNWTQSRVQEEVFGLLARLPKVPFTSDGIEQVKAAVMVPLRQGVDYGGYKDNPAPVVTAPAIGAVSTSDKANRLLQPVRFTAYLAGAIEKIAIQGVVTL
jgi:hypothetical protein